MNIALKATLLVATILMAACSGGEKSLAERYPGPWKTDARLDIGQALVAKKISGCGEYKYKESADDSGEYIVYCTGKHDEQLAYIVWGFSKEVQGPFETDPSLN